MAAWVGLTWLVSRTPPLDNAEQLTWVRQLDWGYYKHPPLPTAVLWPWVQLFGLNEWVTYAAAVGVTGLGLGVGWQLVGRLAGATVADIALLATLCNTHFTQRLAHFNHDVLLMPCVVLAAWWAWRAFERRSRLDWLGVGVALGLGALAKYQVALAGVALLAWWGVNRGWRDSVHVQGLFLAAGVALLILSPNLLWVFSHDWLPVRYAAENSLAHAATEGMAKPSVWKWIGDQLGMALGSLALLIALRWRGRLRSGEAGPVDGPAPRALPFLLCWGVLPLLLMPLGGGLLHARLHANWAFAYLPLTCAAAMLAWRSVNWARMDRRAIVLSFALVQVTLIGVTVLRCFDGWPGLNLSAHPRRFASQQLADQIGPAARAALGGPVLVIAGPYRLAGVLSLRLPERPVVWIDGRSDISPWVPSDLPRRCGVLWVGLQGQVPPDGVDLRPFGDGLWWGVQKAERPGACAVAGSG
jgi:4-amino-4-deoxy-L-arabinose transferase-like glycosyltransferase